MFRALRGGTPKAPEGAAGAADAAPVSKPVDPLLSSEPATPLSTATVSATPASQASVLSSAGRGAGGAGASAGLKPGDVVVFSDIATGTIYRAAAGASCSAAGAGGAIYPTGLRECPTAPKSSIFLRVRGWRISPPLKRPPGVPW